MVGSHSNAPYAETGWAYQREIAEDRIGSIEPGKLADLVLIEGDVLRDIGSMRRIRRVMLNGEWIR